MLRINALLIHRLIRGNKSRFGDCSLESVWLKLSLTFLNRSMSFIVEETSCVCLLQWCIIESTKYKIVLRISIFKLRVALYSVCVCACVHNFSCTVYIVFAPFKENQ